MDGTRNYLGRSQPRHSPREESLLRKAGAFHLPTHLHDSSMRMSKSLISIRKFRASTFVVKLVVRVGNRQYVMNKVLIPTISE